MRLPDRSAMSSIPLAVLWHGVDRPPPDPIPLRAGPLSAMFDPELAFLRYVRLGSREVLRGVYSAVRDQHWGTVAPRVTNLQIRQDSESFDLDFDVECCESAIDFVWRGAISGSRDGSIVFSMFGVARSTFCRNRIGFCVLHPIAECAGHKCQVESADGELSSGQFPKLISPHQPFKNIRAISHEVVPGVRAEVRMTGDVFEMEDQRNWSDASFKTYCTPLAFPFPVEIVAGTTISQEIRISVSGDVHRGIYGIPDQGEIIVEVGEEPAGIMPEIGLLLATDNLPLNPSEIARLRSLKLRHLRVDLALDHDRWPDDLARAARAARDISVGLEAALFLGTAPADKLSAVAQEAQALSAPLARWLIFHVGESATSPRWLHLARQSLATHGGRVPIGAGTPGNFTELNRNRPDQLLPDLICFSTNPQVHAFDDRSLVETLPMHLHIAETARSFVGSLPIAVTPLTLRPSPNPANPERGEGGVSGGPLPASVDPRQMSLFAAGWLVGALKYLAAAGIHSVTCFETTGWRGVMETETDPPAPELFRSIQGCTYPVYHVLADVSGEANEDVLRTSSSDPLSVECLALKRRGSLRLLVANLGPKRQTVVIRGCRGPLRMRMLDETNVLAAMVSAEEYRSTVETPLNPAGDGFRLQLRPFAVACLEGDRAER